MRKIYNCDPGCPVQSTLQFISGKWKTVIMYHLFKNSKLGFPELQRKLPYVNKRMLSKQLLELEKDNIIHKEIYPVVPVKTEYTLTNFGKSFEPIVNAMEIWGENFNQNSKRDH